MLIRILRIGVGVALVSATIVGCQKKTAPAPVIRPVRTTRLVAQQVIEGQKFPGFAEAYQEVTLSFRVAGTVKAFEVLKGDFVQADQVVAVLDANDFEVDVRNAEANLAKFNADAALAENVYQRTKVAYESAGVSDLELAVKRETWRAAVAQVSSAQAKLDAAQDSLRYATLLAPFDGQVTETYVEAFEDIQAKEAVLRILDDSRIEMTVYLPEHLAADRPTPDEIRCEFDAFPGLVLVAKVVEFSTEADAVTRTYAVTLIMDQPAHARILPGMTGNAWTVIEQQAAPGDPDFVVTTTALGEDADGGRFVWIVEEPNHTVTRRDVDVGEIALDGVRVGGLNEGELVVTAGVSLLTEGQQVRIADGSSTGDGR